MRRLGLFLAIMLVVVVNIALLAGVWYNRTGPPDAILTLTERELPLVNAQEDDSGIALRISYRNPELDQDETWLDRAKLEELGFDYPEGELPRNLNLIRSALLVLELAEEAAKKESRLIVVDAGLDTAALRRSYGDSSRYIVAPGAVRLFIDREDAIEDKLRARVRSLQTSLIHVPKAHASFLAGLEGHAESPRYAVTLHYGRRLEPWVVKVEPLEAE